MNKIEFKILEEKYVKLFKERTWILRFLNLSDKEKNKLLIDAIKNKKRIEL